MLARLRDGTERFPLSRLTVTIILTQFFGLTVLMLGSMSNTQYRDGLIAAKLEGVRAQSQVIASIIATAAAEDAACDILPDPAGPVACDVSLNEAEVSTIFTRVWPSFEGRVRVFETPDGYGGGPIVNAREILLQDKLLRTGRIEVGELPPINAGGPTLFTMVRGLMGDLAHTFVDTFIDPGLRSQARRNTLEDELHRAFLSDAGNPNPGASSLRYDEEGELVASVSVPIRKVQAVYGVVTAEIGGIEGVLDEARSTLFNFFLVAMVVAAILSVLLTMTIAAPIRKLARAADRVRDGIRGAGRMRIPDFPRRRDEIGELSDSLKSMTQALYDRIEAIDHFAADVSHELKNPLTSIRSAIETLDIAEKPEARERLMAVVKNDVVRMDRLITDISNASRLDAELARESREAVPVLHLLKDIAASYEITPRNVPVSFTLATDEVEVFVFGSPTNLGQIFRNLIDNALSFSPDGGSVRVIAETLRDKDGTALVARVEDDGPGVPEDNLESIFKRFYTRRPQGTRFGNNSGLGLAICRQIAESHNGQIWAENRRDEAGDGIAGAVFFVRLPTEGYG